MRKTRVLLLVSLVLGPLSGFPQASDLGSTLAVVREFLDAFNAHDAAAMSAMVADDVQWLSVRGSEISIELEGRAALVAAMGEYFTSCPTCRSEIKGQMSSSERVSVVEVASWVGSKGPRSQQSIAVYEFSDSLIQRIYYFPEEAVLSRIDPATP
ncbi:MAG: nuclear transport factor 2 family protein [Woeseiaceae bacterium]|nr:nuclear transport factor 2 family protein [Woeseiaceae bacterium]